MTAPDEPRLVSACGVEGVEITSDFPRVMGDRRWRPGGILKAGDWYTPAASVAEMFGMRRAWERRDDPFGRLRFDRLVAPRLTRAQRAAGRLRMRARAAWIAYNEPATGPDPEGVYPDERAW